MCVGLLVGSSVEKELDASISFIMGSAAGEGYTHLKGLDSFVGSCEGSSILEECFC